jgi:hypothetical protein
LNWGEIRGRSRIIIVDEFSLDKKEISLRNTSIEEPGCFAWCQLPA